MENSRKEQIINILENALSISHLQVNNESKFHHVPKDSETHFKVTIVSPDFEAKKLIQRHKQINQLLAAELANGLHALSIHAYTPTEWEARQPKSRPSPHCRDGFDK